VEELEELVSGKLLASENLLAVLYIRYEKIR